MPGLDFQFDPQTGDLIDADDGWFVEVSSSETAVFMQLRHHFNAWFGEPSAGSLLYQAREHGDGERGREFLVTEIQRSLAPLVADGYVASVRTRATRSAIGRVVVELSYRDLKSGQQVDLLLSPFGGS